MKKTIISIIILAVAGVGVWYVIHNQQSAEPTDDTEQGVDNDQQVTADEQQPSPSTQYVKPEQIPAGWGLFYEESQMTRLNRVTEVMNTKKPMDPELYAFFKAELFNRDHWDVTRNNMANALVRARDADGNHPDPDLHEVFIAMLEDETEDTVWRDYCLQFLSEHLPNSSEPDRVKEVITKFSKGDDSIAGTAMVHMALHEQEGDMQLDDDFNEQLAEQLENPDVHRDTRLAILGVMGKRKDIDRLPLIRKYAKQDEDAGLKRVAIAALGTIGASPETAAAITDDDKTLIRAALHHKNHAVIMAAESALAKIEDK